MSPPLVAVTAGIATDRLPERITLNASYLRAIEAAGGIPVILAPGAEGAIEVVAGLVLTGGGDIDPALYGESPDDTVVGVSGQRDSLEINALKRADERGLPVLAICRGMQVLNVYRGGSLHQHIPDAFPEGLAHAVPTPRCGPAHDVRLDDSSRIAGICGAGVLQVNSRHHQAVRSVGKGLVVTGCAPDGVIEAVEVPGERFLVGVQWHPEDMVGQCASADALFAAFVAACVA
jgi:putative glutamine amidotransferase